MATRSWFTPGGYVTADDALISDWYTPGIGYFSEETALDVVQLQNYVRTYFMPGGGFHSVDDAPPEDYFVPNVGYLTERSVIQILPGVEDYNKLALLAMNLPWEVTHSNGVSTQAQIQQNLGGYPGLLWGVTFRASGTLGLLGVGR
jgi:hypothetical protein